MLVSMVEERLAGLWEHESKLGRQYAQAEEEAVQLNDRMAELRMVEHELTRLRNLHDALLARINNIDIGKDQTDLRVAVVSEPKASNRPVSPRLSLVGMLCLLGGLGVGVALVYVLDVLDDRFRSPEELQEQLRVPVLAMIRQLSSPQACGPGSHPGSRGPGIGRERGLPHAADDAWPSPARTWSGSRSPAPNRATARPP